MKIYMIHNLVALIISYYPPESPGTQCPPLLSKSSLSIRETVVLKSVRSAIATIKRW